MPGCCSTFETAATRQFSERKAAGDLQQYRKKGPGATTRLLLDGIAAAGPLDGSVLDVGSGVGSLTFELLGRGITRAVAVDASSAYIGAAREEASRRGRAGAITFVHADFVAAESQLPQATIVVLDRVVCCYPEYEPLLEAALRHAERCVALSYPRDNWYGRLVCRLENLQRRITGNAFQTFVHPGRDMERIITGAGFQRSSRRTTWLWAIDVYTRRPAAT
jgi:magnesium-protoporphyrin O-methyltransferase